MLKQRERKKGREEEGKREGKKGNTLFKVDNFLASVHLELKALKLEKKRLFSWQA